MLVSFVPFPKKKKKKSRRGGRTIANNFVARPALDMAACQRQRSHSFGSRCLEYIRSEAYATGILLELRVIKTLLQGKGARPGLVLRRLLVREDGARVSILHALSVGLELFGFFDEGDLAHAFAAKGRRIFTNGDNCDRVGEWVLRRVGSSRLRCLD